MDRHLDWPGCINARDLGGLRTADGRETTWGAVVRSDNPAYLTAEGWTALHDYGIRSIVALRTLGADDDEPDSQMMPRDVRIERVVVEDGTDPLFVQRCIDTVLWCTPIYFAEMLDRWPERCAAAVSAVSQAPPGGVVISCGRGCDRTGLVAFLLLAIVGVSAQDIAADWAMSVDRLRSRDPTFEASLHDVLDRERTSVSEAIERTLDSFDIPSRLIAGGLPITDLEVIKDRLVVQRVG